MEHLSALSRPVKTTAQIVSERALSDALMRAKNAFHESVYLILDGASPTDMPALLATSASEFKDEIDAAIAGSTDSVKTASDAFAACIDALQAVRQTDLTSDVSRAALRARFATTTKETPDMSEKKNAAAESNANVATDDAKKAAAKQEPAQQDAAKSALDSLSPEQRAAVEGIIQSRTEQARLEAEEAEIAKRAGEATAARLAEVEKRNAQFAAELETLRAEKEAAMFAEKARKFSVGQAIEDIAECLKTAWRAGEEHGKRLETVLGSYRAMAKHGRDALTSSSGVASKASPDDTGALDATEAHARLEALARDAMKSAPDMNFHSAYARALRAYPKLASAAIRGDTVRQTAALDDGF